MVLQSTQNTSSSSMWYMATITTAARLVFGMNLKVGVRRLQAKSTRRPVKMPPIGVLTPEALFTAVLVKLPAVGIDLTKLPKMLLRPTANIS